MSFPPKYTMRIAKKAHLSEEEAGIMTIVVHKAYAHLERELRRAFKGQEDVKVILDRRQGERRKRRRQAVGAERRKADRRYSKEEIVEVVVST